mmetsp:Transcript_23953/g.52107  ORF Transcript_23953/g.52107 Transcript_23953/m.52107 type:complete len:299 (-) Transcript_23953:576-1472(-)
MTSVLLVHTSGSIPALCFHQERRKESKIERGRTATGFSGVSDATELIIVASSALKITFFKRFVSEEQGKAALRFFLHTESTKMDDAVSSYSVVIETMAIQILSGKDKMVDLGFNAMEQQHDMTAPLMYKSLSSWRTFLGKKKKIKSATPPKRDEHLKTLCMIFADTELVHNKGRDELDITSWVETYKEKADDLGEVSPTDTATEGAHDDDAQNVEAGVLEATDILDMDNGDSSYDGSSRSSGTEDESVPSFNDTNGNGDGNVATDGVELPNYYCDDQSYDSSRYSDSTASTTSSGSRR